jgi:NAD(P)H-flavin reductase
MAINEIPAVITDKSRITPSVLRVRFQLQEDMSYEPGQFISIHFPAEEQMIRRSYSIANVDGSSPTSCVDIVLTVLPDGLASQFLDKAEKGTRLGISGPYGAMTPPKQLPQRLILVATSTGVAPFVNMLPSLEKAMDASSEAHEVELLLGVRNREEELFQEHLRDFSRSHAWFRLSFCLSRDTPTQEDEYAGHVHDRLAALNPDPGKDLVYLCGNPAMVDEVFGALSSSGFTPRQVRREKYVASRRA